MADVGGGGGRDEQASAEQLDDDRVDLEGYPPDNPQGVVAFGTAQVEEEGRESVRQRAAQEDPREDLREREPPVAGLLEPDEDGAPDVTAESIALQGDEPDLPSAEEAAMHIAEPPN